MSTVDVERPSLPDRLLDAGEVAVMLNVTRRQVEDMTRRGELPCVPVGRFKRYRPERIAEWIGANETL
jgi:excisionase family DNA binding protein